MLIDRTISPSLSLSLCVYPIFRPRVKVNRVSNHIGGQCPCQVANSFCHEQTRRCICKDGFLPSREDRKCVYSKSRRRTRATHARLGMSLTLLIACFFHWLSRFIRMPLLSCARHQNRYSWVASVRITSSARTTTTLPTAGNRFASVRNTLCFTRVPAALS